MARHVLIALGNPVKGKEKQFDEWYESQHMVDCLNVPGVVSARRYRIDQEMTGPVPYQFAAIYEIEGDPTAVMKELGARVGTKLMTMSEALDTKSGAILLGAVTKELKAKA